MFERLSPVRWVWPLVVAALLCAFWAGAGQAAEITAPGLNIKAREGGAPSDPAKCDMVLEGLIEPGDTQKLWKVHEQAEFRRRHIFLCLRSGGGDVVEALAMAKSMANSFMMTVIEDGRTCASACAYVFMAGQALGRRVRTPQRFLHARGRLMFHSSYIPLEGASDAAITAWANRPAEQVRRSLIDTYAQGLRDLQVVLGVFSHPGQVGATVGAAWVRPSLLVEVFAKAPTEWTCIDTVDQVGRYDIETFGATVPKEPGKRMLREACHNAFVWRRDAFAGADRDVGLPEDEASIKVTSPPPGQMIGGRNADSHFFKRRFVVEYGWRTVHQCVVEIHNDDADRLHHLSVFFIEKEGTRATDVYQLDPLALLPPETLLRSTAATAARASPRTAAPRSFKAIPDRAMVGCDMRRLAGTTLADCEAACAGDTKCQAYTYNRWSRACELKHTANDVRLDPSAVTGVPIRNGVPLAVKPSVHQTALEDMQVRFTGKEIAAQTVEDTGACAAMCDPAKGCLGYTYAGETRICRTFSSIESSVAAPSHYSAMWKQ